MPSNRESVEKDARSASRRVRKKIHKYIHCHTVLIAICTLSVLDAGFVMGELIVDILMFKEEQTAMTRQSHVISDFLTHLLPNFFDKNSSTLGDLTHIIARLPPNTVCNMPDSMSPTAAIGHNRTTLTASTTAAIINDVDETPPTHLNQNLSESSLPVSSFPVGTETEINSSTNGNESSHRVKRQSGSGVFNHHISKRSAGSSSVKTLAYEVSHALHFGSISILSLMVLVVILRVYALQCHFFKRKLEVWDAIVVGVAFCLDLFLLDGIQQHIDVDAAYLIIIVMPWRIIRVINSFVMTVKEKDKIRLKYLLTSRKKALRKVAILEKKVERQKRDDKALRGLCKRHGIKDKKIEECLSAYDIRKRSFPLAMLTSFTSLTMIGSLGSSPPRDQSDDDFSDTDVDDVIDKEQNNANYEEENQVTISSVSDSGYGFNLETMDETSQCRLPNLARLSRRRSTSLDSLESVLSVEYDDVTGPHSTVSISSGAQLSVQMDSEASSDVFEYDEMEAEIAETVDQDYSTKL